MKKSKLNKSEQKLHDKLNEASFSYQEKHWTQLKPNLKPVGIFPSWLKIAVVVLLGATATYYFVSDSNETPENPINASKTKTLNQEFEAPGEKIKKELIPKLETAIPNKIMEAVNHPEEQSIQIENTTERDLTLQEEIDLVSTEIKSEDQADQDELTITENDPNLNENSTLVIDELVLIGSPCIGNKIQILVNSKEAKETNYTWKLDGEKIDHSLSSLELTIEKIGLNIVTVSNEFSEKSIEFEVFETPEIDFTYTDLKDAYWDEAAQLNATPEELEYTWEIESMDNKIVGNNQTIDFASQGLYDVELIYIDKNGCETHKEKPINIQSNFDPLAPNGFTPFGDNLNEDFIPLGFFETPGSFIMSIYDINGNLVYKTRSKDEPWNGKENNMGHNLPIGTYVWKVEISHENRTKAFTGQIKILNL